jgi:hypothetical protein
MHNVGLGVAFGVAIGTSFSLIFHGAAMPREKVAVDKPPTHPLGL